jgi:hypothetical protein
MKPIDRRTFLKTVPAVAAVGNVRWQAPASAAPFGQDHPHLDSQTTGQWWVTRASGEPGTEAVGKAAKKVPQIIELNVPRDEIVAFALYAHDGGVLKLTAPLYPLLPDEPVQRGWRFSAMAPGRRSPARRSDIRGGAPTSASNAGMQRRRSRTGCSMRTRRRSTAPSVVMLDNDEVVIANLGCNSSRTKGARPEIVQRLRRQDPDLLFFSGDQTASTSRDAAGTTRITL